MLAYCDENKMKSLPRQAIALDSKSQSRTRVSSIGLSDIGHDDAGDLPTVQEEVPHLLNPLNDELNPICHLLAILGGATIVVVSRLRVKLRYVCHFTYI
jgi:hypothetical protein